MSRMRIAAAGLAVLLLLTSAAAVGQSPVPAPSPSFVPADIGSLFPTAAEVGEAMGLEVEAMGIRDDMSQLWEGTEIRPGGLLARGWQGYRGFVPDAGGAPGEGFAGVSVDIDRFATADAAATAAAHLSAALNGSTLTPFTPFPTRLSGDLVTAGSMTSGGYGGSTVLVQDGPLVVVVVVARTGATEQQVAAEAITAHILARARSEGWLSGPTAEAS